MTLVERLRLLAKRLEDDGMYTNCYICEDAADVIDTLTVALVEAENALADYIPTLEQKTGASLNYGHSVLRKTRTALDTVRKNYNG